MNQNSQFERELGRMISVADDMPLLGKVQCIPAPSDPLNGCILPANITNVEEADEMHMLVLRKKRTSIILFQGNNLIKQRLDTG